MFRPAPVMGDPRFLTRVGHKILSQETFFQIIRSPISSKYIKFKSFPTNFEPKNLQTSKNGLCKKVLIVSFLGEKYISYLVLLQGSYIYLVYI